VRNDVRWYAAQKDDPSEESDAPHEKKIDENKGRVLEEMRGK
jgi:hypothetical protein